MFADVETTDLDNLLNALRASRVAFPVSATGLDRLGAPSLVRHAGALQSFDASTLAVLLEAVLAERANRPATPELVWTGPEGPAATARRTEVVFRHLLESATQSVWMAGYSIDHGSQIFEPLHRVMKERGVRTRFLLHPQYARGERRQPTVQAGAELIINRFLAHNWPFGDPRPDIWYDPRPLERKPRASMHIKAVVVDDARVLIGSANFTNAGQHRNYEAGAYIEDPRFAERLARQLRSLIDAELVLPYGAAA